MNLREIAQTIAAAGGRLYLVGGGVRDQIRGHSAKDLDFCVTGLSTEQFWTHFPNAFLAGRAFPVFRLPVDGHVAEFALARTEHKISVGHRGFQINASEGVTIEQDLERRDLTINALALDVLTNEVIDPFGGQNDIHNRVVRAVSDAFAEDPLRVYRAARFAATLDFHIEPRTTALMRSLRDELYALSAERVFEEVKKALGSARPSVFFMALKTAGVLDVHFGEIASLVGVLQPEKYHPEGDAFEHTMQVLDASARLTERVEVRFAALVHDVGKGVTPREKWPSHHGHEALGVPLARRLCQRLKLPSKWTEAATFATAEHMKMHILHRMKPVKVVDLLMAAQRNPLGVEGLAVVGMSDDRGRNSPNAPSPNAASLDALWRVIQAVNGAAVTTDAIGKQFGEELRKKRAAAVQAWRNREK
ncbi:HD domain-containing protein [Alicyclobacillus fodiniaquatilis]|uniref:HD domain-containing protein n=1 Tax=Alicyclobacillus fodiniaquatilis TaxID=1661150 RepID=A0ABW4JN40_9BACL